MARQPPPEETAAPFVPETRDLGELAAAAQACEGCELYRDATQAVFGAGPAHARILLIGEQPGDAEDKAGQPFVGPSGRLLRQALEQVGIDPDKVYISNAVKHFYYRMTGRRRIHSKPQQRHVSACLPWLLAEIEAVQPEVIVCLGTTAARVVFGKPVVLRDLRGRFVESPLAARTLVTVHPSSILRAPGEDARRQALAEFVADLGLVAGEV